MQASAPGSRDLLERGTVDGIFFPWQSTILFGIDKVTRFAINAQFYTPTFVWVLNKAKYDGMSASQKTVIDDHCTTDWAVRFAGPWADYENGGRAKIAVDPNHTVVNLTPDQLNQWRQAAAPLRDAWAANVRKVNGDPDAIRSEFEGALKERKAEY